MHVCVCTSQYSNSVVARGAAHQFLHHTTQVSVSNAGVTFRSFTFLCFILHRVNFTNVVSLGWNTYVAWIAHR